MNETNERRDCAAALPALSTASAVTLAPFHPQLPPLPFWVGAAVASACVCAHVPAGVCASQPAEEAAPVGTVTP